MRRPRFHLAFPVTDLDTARAFYVDVLGAAVGRTDEQPGEQSRLASRYPRSVAGRCVVLIVSSKVDSPGPGHRETAVLGDLFDAPA